MIRSAIWSIIAELPCPRRLLHALLYDMPAAGLWYSQTSVCTPQEPDEDDVDDSDEEVEAAAARAAGIDVRADGAVYDGGGGGGASLNVQEMRRDAFWLQRRVSQAFSALDADQAQQLAEKVFVTLQVRSARM